MYAVRLKIAQLLEPGVCRVVTAASASHAHPSHGRRPANSRHTRGSHGIDQHASAARKRCQGLSQLTTASVQQRCLPSRGVMHRRWLHRTHALKSSGLCVSSARTPTCIPAVAWQRTEIQRRNLTPPEGLGSRLTSKLAFRSRKDTRALPLPALRAV